MMKFKSLFRRGQHSQQQQQQQSTQQPQQQVPVLRQAPSASSLEAKNHDNNTQTGLRPLAKEANNKSNKTTGTHNTIKGSGDAGGGPVKGPDRMQELENEIDILRKERIRLESDLKGANCDIQSLAELKAELSTIKVRIINFFFLFYYYYSSVFF